MSGIEPTTSDDDDISITNKSPTDVTTTDNISAPKDVPLKKGIVKQINPWEVRWFYKTPKSGTWTPFKGRDSLLIELKWRLVNSVNLGDEFSDKDEALKLCSTTAVVLDGFYELVLNNDVEEVKPIYWQGDSMQILRGTWFFEADWRPLESKIADAIEEQHLKMFLGQTIPDGPVYSGKGPKPLLHSLKLENCQIEWNSIIDITMQVTNRSWTMYLRLKSNLLKLRRSYHEEASLSDGPLPVNHLIFVVHGIGQKRQVNRIVNNTIGMRSVADRMLKQSFSNVTYRPMFIPVEWRTCLKLDEDVVEAITPNKVQFIRDLLNSTVMDILYYTSPKYRSEVIDGMVTVLNKLYKLFIRHNPEFEKVKGEISIVAHSLGSVITYDVITGWSPLQQYEDFVTQRLKHVIESPDVHSDTKQNLFLLQNARQALDDEGGLLKLLTTAEAKTMRLLFKVKHLFCVGSPLSVFLALRGETGKRVFERSQPIIYNVFHPMDPVAYRLEPLVHPLYAKYKPLRIHRSDVKDPTPYVEMLMELNNKKESKRRQSKEKSSPTEMASVAAAGAESNVDSDGRCSPEMKSVVLAKNLVQPPKKSWSFGVFSKFRAESVNVDSSPVKHNQIGLGAGSSSGSAESLNEMPGVSINEVSDVDLLTQIPLESQLTHRLDYVLKESKLDYEIFSGFTSHIGYWNHSDVINFVLSQIYGHPTPNFS